VARFYISETLYLKADMTNKKPAKTSSTKPDKPAQNGKEKVISYLASIIVHGLILLLILGFGVISKSTPPVDNFISIEIVPGGGGGGGGGSTALGQNAGNPDQQLPQGLQQQEQRPTEKEPVLSKTQNQTQEKLPLNQNPTRDNTITTRTTKPQNASSTGQTVQGNGTNGQGGGQGNGQGTGQGNGTGSGTGGGNGSGNGTGNGSGQGAGDGSGSGGGKGNFPAGTFNMSPDLVCGKSMSGDTSGHSATVIIHVKYKGGKASIT
jgi:hypothetical protein